MANKEASADHLLTSNDWHIGQATFDGLRDIANREARDFVIELGEPLARVFIGHKLVGLMNPDTFDIVSWPYIYPWHFSGITHDRLHHDADMSDEKAVCYFIGGETGPVKIGYSIDVKARLSSIRSHSPVPLSILATRSGGRFREWAYHEQFAAHRLHGEWFERVPEIEAEIAKLSSPTPLTPGAAA